MHGEKDKGYTYKPVWQILAIAAVLSAVLIFLGVKGWREGLSLDREKGPSSLSGPV